VLAICRLLENLETASTYILVKFELGHYGICLL